MIDPPRWSAGQLAADAAEAIGVFRRERLQEPLEAYLEEFDTLQGIVEDLLEKTVDLTALEDNALDILSDPALFNAFRYLAGPPISKDDLATVAEAKTFHASRLQREPQTVARVAEVIRIALDRRRFPWVSEDREPTEAERNAAILASAALWATQRVGTKRRSEGKEGLEGLTEGALIGIGFKKVVRAKIATLTDAPRPGEFCGETPLGERKADFVIGLWDNRVMALECKASNSATNSVKRLNNDAAVKAEVWRSDFGTVQVVPAAVLSGVFKLKNLENAQNRGLTIFWGHNLAALTDWIEQTRQ